MYMNVGTRKLQDVKGAFTLNIPIYAVRTLGLRSGDKMHIVLGDDGILRIEKEKGALPDPHLGGSNQAALQPTSNGVDAIGIER